MSVTRLEEVAGGFGALGLDARLVEELRGLGYEEPTPIQREAIPPILAGQGPRRTGRDRDGQDRGVRTAVAAAAFAELGASVPGPPP